MALIERIYGEIARLISLRRFRGSCAYYGAGGAIKEKRVRIQCTRSGETIGDSQRRQYFYRRLESDRSEINQLSSIDEAQ